jgi:hypothetical protein
MAFQIGGATAAATGGLAGRNCQDAFKIRFTTALSSQPKLEAWDNATDLTNNTAPSDEILVGTASSGNNSWLAGCDTFVTRPISGTAGTAWYPAGESAGSSPSLLNGTTGYVSLDGATVGVASRLFNIQLKVPSDAAQSGTTQHTPVIAVRYYYTGTAPGVIWQRNAGAEGAAVWTTMAAGSTGDTIHFTGPDASAIYNDPFTKPAAIASVGGYWIATNGETY